MLLSSGRIQHELLRKRRPQPNCASPLTQKRVTKCYASPQNSLTHPIAGVKRTVTCYDWHEHLVPYVKVCLACPLLLSPPFTYSCADACLLQCDFSHLLVQAWKLQQQLLGQHLDKAQPRRIGSVILLQHPPVLTLGAGSTEDNLLFDPSEPPLPLFRTERGGEATFHGPGQLVLYPILDLQQLKPDLHWYLRSLEEVVIRSACASQSQLKARADTKQHHDFRCCLCRQFAKPPRIQDLARLLLYLKARNEYDLQVVSLSATAFIWKEDRLCSLRQVSCLQSLAVGIWH